MSRISFFKFQVVNKGLTENIQDLDDWFILKLKVKAKN